VKIAILTSPDQWFIPYAKELQSKIKNSKLFYTHQSIEEEQDVIFILSYHKIIPEKYLVKNKHNIVIHASALPAGKGWAPLFWQVLESKSEVTFSMFEASSGVDNGDIYMRYNLNLTGTELNKELRHKQAVACMEMCIGFLENYERYRIPTPQEGAESFYDKRGPQDSRLDLDKTIRDQFNLLRIVDNESYPAFFEIEGCTYTLKIERQNSER